VAGTCAIRLLGGFEVEVNGRLVPPDAWRHRRGAELIKLLALAPGHRLHREQVMDALWPDLPGDAAATNLRKATHHLRRALGTPDPVVILGGSLALCPDWPVTTDVEIFEAAAKEALAAGPDACASAAGLYRGALLPDDRYADWTFEPRERLRLRHLQLLKLGGQWEAVLATDPADEEAHRALMARGLEAGDRQAALRQFAKLRDALRTDLGVGPDRASVELYEKALAMEGSAPAPAERVAGLLAWGLLHWNRMELTEAERCAAEARSLAINAGLGRELGESTTLLGMVAHAQGRWRVLFAAEFAEVMAHRPALAPLVFDAHLCLAELSLYGPDSHRQIEPFARALLETATDAGSLHGQGLAWLMLGEADFFAGRLPEASANLARAAELHRAAEAESALALTLIRSAETELARGRRWQASRVLDKATRAAGEAPLAAHLLIRAHAVQVQAARTSQRATDVLDGAEIALRSAPACQPCSIGFHVIAAATRARAGDLRAAQQQLETAERIAGMWPGGPWQASVWEARGLVRLAEGDRDQGVALLNEAASRFDDAGRPLDVARCRGEATGVS
jgi:DNA-binding SARP family transcriptional activator